MFKNTWINTILNIILNTIKFCIGIFCFWIIFFHILFTILGPHVHWKSGVSRSFITFASILPLFLQLTSIIHSLGLINLKFTFHFLIGTPSTLFDDNNPDWAPSLVLGYNWKPTSECTKNEERYLRTVNRSQKRKIVHLPPSLYEQEETRSVTVTNVNTVFDNEEQSNIEIITKNNPSSQVNTVECMTDLTMDTINQMEFKLTLMKSFISQKSSECMTDLTMADINNTELGLIQSNKELHSLREKVLCMDISEDSFRSDEDKVKFYTGLPSFAVFMTVFYFLSGHVQSSCRNSLTLFQECLLFFVRLRLNVPLQDLAYRFNISQATASRVFEKWLNVVYIRLGGLVIWPDRETLQKTMPRDFKLAFGNNVSVILDCFEVFIAKPSSLFVRAVTWSQYKHHNTVKFLIGITPQGSISFISEAWGGRVSDKYLTEHSGVLNNLLPGDKVLADRGFNISDSVGFSCAQLIIPAFTKGKIQLDSLEVSETRKLASLRIHVERVIGLVRNKYHILQGVLPIEFLYVKQGQTAASIDKIVVACCALTNLSPSVVP